MRADRLAVLHDDTARGLAWCARYTGGVDRWLVELLHAAQTRADDRIALVAVGGYGRNELCPHSDLDVVLLHAGRGAVDEVASRIWYPIWDADVKLGHSVCTPRQALALAAGDLDTATAILDARLIAGDTALFDELRDGARREWRKRAHHWIDQLATRVVERHEAVGEVAFLLEPDLKDGRGGLRDVQSLHWAAAATDLDLRTDAAALARAYDVLVAARVELHRATQRASNVLALQEQDGVAAALGVADADALMADVARAARLIAWTSDDAWRRARGPSRSGLSRLGRRERVLEPGMTLRDGEVHIDRRENDCSTYATTVLRAARLAAMHDAVLAHESLETLDTTRPFVDDPWSDAARAELLGLLGAGPGAIAVIESLDHHGVWTRVFPEWDAVRSRPQRSAYHRFTVDRHLLETVKHAAAIAPRVDRPDLLLLAALLHDIGKGDDGDHVAAGVRRTSAVATRLGLDASDRDRLVELVEHHLLLSEVATRRDLDDPATARWVATRVTSAATLHLLAALTEADSLATGPAAWGPTKAALVATLVQRVEVTLGAPPGLQLAARVDAFPTAAQLTELASGGTRIRTDGNELTVMTDDRPGTFSKVAGVLSVHGLEVVSALAYSSETGRALSQFRVASRHRGDLPWTRVERDLARALDGRFALAARVRERSVQYARRHQAARRLATAGVRFENAGSDRATIIDVHAPDGEGVLYRITRALTEFDLDIRSAHVQTLGHQVADAFYVVDRNGAKVTDPATLAEIERAILDALE